MRFILILLILTSCTSNGDETKSPTENIESIKRVHKYADSSEITSEKFEEILGFRNYLIDNSIHLDTISINTTKIIQGKKKGRLSFILNFDGNFIVPEEDFYHQVSYLDINDDGFKDIRVFIMSNSPNQCDNYLFNPNKKEFILIDNCFSDIKKLDAVDKYYSYESQGCSDHSWISELSVIIADSLHKIGLMKGDECNKNDALIKVYFYKDGIKENFEEVNRKLFENNTADNKWAFIEKYWDRSHLSFSVDRKN